MKKYLKISIILLLLAFITFFVNTKVEANTNVNEEQAKQMLNLIPDSIEIDLKEIENVDYQAETLVKEKVHNILNENGINMEEVKELEDQDELRIFNVGSKGGYQYSSINDFYEAKITIEANGISEEKKVKIVYSNHKNYNTKDEQYIKNFKIENKKYFETDLKFACLDKNEERLNQFLKIVNKYYESLFNDKDITVITSLGAGSISELNELMGSPDDELYASIMIFKNDILYDLRYIGTPTSIPVVTVPYNIDDTEISSYVLNLIKTTYGTSYDTSKLSIKKGVSESSEENYLCIDKNIPNIYTVYDNAKGNNYPFGWLIINKEKSITSTDKATNVQLKASEDAIPENTVLEAKIVNDETTLNQIRVSMQDTSTKYITYDITLKSNNIAIKPNGKVQISIPIPKDFDKNNLIVYRIEANGNRIAYEIKLKSIDGQDYAMFETDHFSNYVLAEKVIDITTQQNNNEHILDNEPKTGYNISNEIRIVVLLFTTIAIAYTIRKYNK